MKEAIEEFVHKEVAVAGNRLVVTSRPEGVRLELYEDRFIVINLLQVTRCSAASALGRHSPFQEGCALGLCLGLCFWVVLWGCAWGCALGLCLGLCFWVVLLGCAFGLCLGLCFWVVLLGVVLWGCAPGLCYKDCVLSG